MISAIVLSAVMALETPLSAPDAERRAQQMFMEIKCVVCEGEPIAQSSAEIAQDMRVHIRSQISAGKTDQQIRDDLASRYGEQVLLRPRAAGAGWFLWAFPLIAFVGGGLVLWRVFARRRAAYASLTPEKD